MAVAATAATAAKAARERTRSIAPPGLTLDNRGGERAASSTPCKRAWRPHLCQRPRLPGGLPPGPEHGSGLVVFKRDEAWRQAAAWRESSAMFEARSQQLEAALAAIQQQGNGNTGAAFLGGLLGFSAGVALSEYNTS